MYVSLSIFYIRECRVKRFDRDKLGVAPFKNDSNDKIHKSILVLWRGSCVCGQALKMVLAAVRALCYIIVGDV